jgi:DNA-binding NarL/FixJ family response regulator
MRVILLVDDDPLVRRALRRVLERKNFMVIQAEGFQEARDLLEADSRPDVVVTDIVLSDGFGTDLHRWAVEHVPALAPCFVFVSGGMPPEVQAYLEGLPNQRFLKPVHESDLLAAIDKVTGEG